MLNLTDERTIAHYISDKINNPYIQESHYGCTFCNKNLYVTYEAEIPPPPWSKRFGNPSLTERMCRYFNVKFKNIKCVNSDCKAFNFVIDMSMENKEASLERAENFYRSMELPLNENAYFYNSKDQKKSLKNCRVYFHFINSYIFTKMQLLYAIKRIPGNNETVKIIEDKMFFDFFSLPVLSRENSGLMVSLSETKVNPVLVPLELFDFKKPDIQAEWKSD